MAVKESWQVCAKLPPHYKKVYHRLIANSALAHGALAQAIRKYTIDFLDITERRHNLETNPSYHANKESKKGTGPLTKLKDVDSEEERGKTSGGASIPPSAFTPPPSPEDNEEED
jgi:hypothetical protein